MGLHIDALNCLKLSSNGSTEKEKKKETLDDISKKKKEMNDLREIRRMSNKHLSI